MLNIVIPMAGLGSRFSKAGYTDPKPLIPVHGVPMIQLVIENLRPKSHLHAFTFLVQAEHIEKYDLKSLLCCWGGANSQVIALDGLTDGAACTVLAAKSVIDSGDPLMIANCDQYVDVSIDAYLGHMEKNNLDGLIMTMEAADPKWSFVGLDSSGVATRVVEKEVISNEATVGIYNFRRGRDFVCAAEKMIAKNLRVNNEFYVAPTYNELIQEGQRIGIYNIGGDGAGMYGLGIPADLESFLALPLSQSAAREVK